MRLKECRAKRGLSVRALATKAELHYVSLVNIEGGKADPRLSTLLKLTKALDVTLGELVGERQPKKGGRGYDRR